MFASATTQPNTAALLTYAHVYDETPGQTESGRRIGKALGGSENPWLSVPVF